MSILTTFLWLLVIVVGTPLFLTSILLRINAVNNRDLDALNNLDFRTLRFEQIPYFVRILVGKYRAEALAAGFIELTCFIRVNFGAANFCCVLVSPDRKAIVCVEYARINPLTLMILLFFKPRDFLRCLIGIHGATLESIFIGGRRFITTRQAFLASDHIPLQKEFNIVSSNSKFPELKTDHNQKVNDICCGQNLRLQSFDSEQDYFDFERKVLKDLADRIRQIESNGDKFPQVF